MTDDIQNPSVNTEQLTHSIYFGGSSISLIDFNSPGGLNDIKSVTISKLVKRLLGGYMGTIPIAARWISDYYPYSIIIESRPYYVLNHFDSIYYNFTLPWRLDHMYPKDHVSTANKLNYFVSSYYTNGPVQSMDSQLYVFTTDEYNIQDNPHSSYSLNHSIHAYPSWKQLSCSRNIFEDHLSLMAAQTGKNGKDKEHFDHMKLKVLCSNLKEYGYLDLDQNPSFQVSPQYPTVGDLIQDASQKAYWPDSIENPYMFFRSYIETLGNQS